MAVTLVAGGAGFLGSAVARRLAGTPGTVLVADYFGESGDGRAAKEARAVALQKLPNVTVLRLDLSSRMMVEAVLRRHRPSAVVNAALFDPRGPGLPPFVQACLSTAVGYFLHLSDAALYPGRETPEGGAREDEPLDAVGDAYLTQRLGEEALLENSGLRDAILRVFPLIGPDLPEKRFPMPELETLLRGETVLLSDDEPRDFIHVDDAARGVEAALERRPSREIVNLGSGVATRPSDVLKALAVRSPHPLSFQIAEALPARRPRVANPEKARTVLGFSPQLRVADATAGILARRFPETPAPNPVKQDPPTDVSRRELFDFFRRPFDRGGPRG